MGGRGQSDSNGWTREIKRNATASKTEIKVGKKSAYTDKELHYNKPDAQVSDSVRDKEASIRDLEYEVGMIFDKDGNLIDRKEGTESSVRGLDIPEGGTLTHNHPWYYSSDSEDVGMGGTLSAGDIAKFRRYGLQGLKTIRATTFEGTYSLTKNKNYNPETMTKVEGIIREKTENLNKELERIGNLKWNRDAQKNSGLTFSQWVKKCSKEYTSAQNNAIAEMNNILYRYQKSGGYTYTLEKRYRKSSKN